ncbi:MarR family winged helix-turn-helix transcriptional regulator [Streptomyces sp. NPDC001380]|uniref:MarR family winged helix-turn-helix transcriptional regulator n=1 Tax=Streptomyces sp. NPDC001380 TaxID=3364566 RepID=UPI00367E1729
MDVRDAAPEDAYRSVEQELALLFRRARARATEMAREVHPELEGSAYPLLAYIGGSGRVRLTDIGLHFGVGKGTVSRQIKTLESLGLVSRESDPLDGRVYLVSLTEEGDRRYTRAREARMGSIRTLLGAWEPADVSAFAGLLHRFNELMESG